MATFKAIKSKKLKLPTRVLPQAQKILTDFQREGVREASRYPAQKPPTDPTRKAYKRTGSLGRSWSRESGIVGQGRTLTARVISAPGTAPYNIHVVGPKTGPKGKRQRQEMARRNWTSAPQLLGDLWDDRYVPRFEALLTNRR